MAEHPLPQQEIFNRVYKGSKKTGDNVDGLAMLPYGWGSDSKWARQPLPLVDQPWDYIAMSDPDTNGNYQTLTFKAGGSSGSTVRTLAFTFDTANNVTSIGRS